MIGSVLKSYRKEAGMTQEELAQAAGVHRTYISLLERNQKSPTLKVYFQLCQALDSAPSKFMADIEKSMEEGG
jgi:transcriptional regulator with XRE-family HTH domain